MRSAMSLNLIQGVIANMAMKIAIERTLKISSLFLLAVFELFSKLFVVLIEIHCQMVYDVVKMNLP